MKITPGGYYIHDMNKFTFNHNENYMNLRASRMQQDDVRVRVGPETGLELHNRMRERARANENSAAAARVTVAVRARSR